MIINIFLVLSCCMAFALAVVAQAPATYTNGVELISSPSLKLYWQSPQQVLLLENI